MPPKIDVVACYYNQARYAEAFAWGMRENSELIHRIFVVSDGLWRYGEDRQIGKHFPKDKYHPLWHKKCAHGVGTGFNQAARESDADYLYFMSFDQILPPKHLEKMAKLAHPERLVIGHVDSIDEDTRVSDLPHSIVTRKDAITEKAKKFRAMDRPWCYARNGCTLVNRETFRSLGGFDERFSTIGYGLEDLEFGARFYHRYGLDSIVLSSARSWHFSSRTPTIEERHKKLPKPEAFAILANTLAKLYAHKYVLFAEKLYARDAVLATHTSQVAPGADIRVNCVYPDWIPPGSAYSIETTLPNPHVDDPYRHIAYLADALEDYGVIRVVGDPDLLLLEKLGEDLSLQVDLENDCVELSRD